MWQVMKHKAQSRGDTRQYGTELNIFKLWKISFTTAGTQYAYGMHDLYIYTQ